MAFFDINNFHVGGYSPDCHAYNSASKEANQKFASRIAAAKAVWAATPETIAFWELKAPEQVTPPYEDAGYYYTRHLWETPEEGPRMKVARERQRQHQKRHAEYLEAKTAYEQQHVALQSAAWATPQAVAYFGLIKECEEWLLGRKAVLYKQYLVAYEAAGRPDVWPV